MGNVNSEESLGLLSKHIMCSSLNIIFDWRRAQTNIHREQQAVCDTADYTNLPFNSRSRSPSWALFQLLLSFQLSFFAPHPHPHPPSFSSLNPCRPPWFDLITFPLTLPSVAFSLAVQSGDKLNVSPLCNGGNISLWQCSISPGAAYLLTDWINVLYLVWEATCSGSEGYSHSAHRPAR